MSDLKKYWLYILVLCIACFFLGRFAVPSSVTRVTSTQASIQTHTGAVRDSVHINYVTRLVSVSAPLARTTNEIKGNPIPDTAPCGGFVFHAVVPYDDSSGYDDLTDSVDCGRGIEFGVKIEHSKRSIAVTDSSKFSSHTETRRDSSARVFERDSSTQTHTLYDVEAILSIPDFQRGLTGLPGVLQSLSETKAAVRARYYLGDLSIGLRPELQLIPVFTAHLNLDVGVRLLHKNH